jgi:hypothetical protein
MTKEDVAPRLRELAEQKAKLEADIADAKNAQLQKPVKSSADVVVINLNASGLKDRVILSPFIQS